MQDASEYLRSVVRDLPSLIQRLDADAQLQGEYARSGRDWRMAPRDLAPSEVAEFLRGVAKVLAHLTAAEPPPDGPYIAEACVVRCSACHRKVCDVDMEYHEHLTECDAGR